MMMMKIFLALALFVAHWQSIGSCFPSSRTCSDVASRIELCGPPRHTELRQKRQFPPYSEMQNGISAAMMLRNLIVSGGRYVIFHNREKRLPIVSGKSFYVEGDVNNVRPRDAKRVVLRVTKESDGCYLIDKDFYYTNDHYRSFHSTSLC